LADGFIENNLDIPPVQLNAKTSKPFIVSYIHTKIGIKPAPKGFETFWKIYLTAMDNY